jgi:hypothetical protein
MGDPSRLAPIDAILSAQGRTYDDLSVGVADLFNGDDRSGSILAIRLRDTDPAEVGIPLLLGLQGITGMDIGRTPEVIVGKGVLMLDIEGRDPAVPVHLYSHGDIAWFIEADTCVRYTLEQGCEASEVDRPLLEEILSKLP